MDDLADSIIDRETALANFDHARNDFLRAFAQVPDKALSYKPQGDDYSIGDLLPHVIGSIDMYTIVLETMEGIGWVLVHPYEGDPGQMMKDRAAEMQALYAGGEGREGIVAELEKAHDRLASKLRDMVHEEYSRQAPVHYPTSEQPFLTSASAILGWLTDHYNEHIAQVWQMIEGWEKQK